MFNFDDALFVNFPFSNSLMGRKKKRAVKRDIRKEVVTLFIIYLFLCIRREPKLATHTTIGGEAH